MPRTNADSIRALKQRAAEIDRERKEIHTRYENLSAEKTQIEDQIKDLEQNNVPTTVQSTTEVNPSKNGPNNAEKKVEQQPQSAPLKPAQPRLTKKQKAEDAEFYKALKEFKASQSTTQPVEPPSPPRETTTKASRRAKRIELANQKKQKSEHDTMNALHMRALFNKINSQRNQNSAAAAVHHENTTEA